LHGRVHIEIRSLLHAIDRFALTVDCAALLDDRSFAPPNCGANGFALTTESTSVRYDTIRYNRRV